MTEIVKGCFVLEIRSVTEYGELIEKFYPKKVRNELLFENMARIDSLQRRSERVHDCGNWLEFAHGISHDGEVSQDGKLFRASFCRDRLCPMCNWRRRLKIYHQTKSILKHIDNQRYIFLTLTVPNVSELELNVTIDRFQDAFKKMFHPRDGKCMSFVNGYIRTLEITYNEKRNDYHPHFHAILAVSPSYFSGRDYKKNMWWVNTWSDCWRDCGGFVPPSGLSVRVRAIRPNQDNDMNSAVLEVTKYAVKDAEFLTETNNPFKFHVLETIAMAIKGRRMFTLGGIFRQVWAELRLDDAEDGDLIITSDDDRITDDIVLMLHYTWKGPEKGYKFGFGNRQYRKAGVSCDSF